MIRKIQIVKETRNGEKRVALVPDDVRILIEQGYQVFLEANAGQGAGFEDALYKNVGAEIVDCNSLQFTDHTLIVRVKRGTREREQWELNKFNQNTIMIGFLDPLKEERDHINEWCQAGITTFSLEMVDLPNDDKRNASAAMSRLAGAIAFTNATTKYNLKDRPAVFVLGTGAAALSAAEDAVKKGYVVTIFGRKELYRQAVESLGAHYNLLPNNNEAQIKWIRPYLRHPSIVIAAARRIGERCPILIDSESLTEAFPGSVYVDLCGQGRNIEGSQYDHDVIRGNNILITNDTGYPKSQPVLASILYSQCLREFIIDIVSQGITIQNPILSKCYVTCKHKLNPFLYF